MMYNKELREPQWVEVPRSEQKQRQAAASNFKRSYHPNGTQVQMKQFEE